MSKTKKRALNLRIRVLREELTTCTTAAMIRCVQETIDAVLAELAAS